MRPRPTISHGHVALLGDDDDELNDEPMAWTPENDPDQLHYNHPPPDEEDDEPDPGDEADDDADETEDAGPPSRAEVITATQGLMADVRSRFKQVRQMGMPQGLRRKDVVFALFVQGDGRVKVLR